MVGGLAALDAALEKSKVLGKLTPRRGPLDSIRAADSEERARMTDECRRAARRAPAASSAGSCLDGGGALAGRPTAAPLPALLPQNPRHRRDRGLLAQLKELKLSNQAIWDREHAREAAGGGVQTTWRARTVLPPHPAPRALVLISLL